MTTTNTNDTRLTLVNKINWVRLLLAAISIGPLLLFAASQMGKYFFVCELISNFQLFIFLTLLPFPFLLGWLGMKRLATILGGATLWSFVLISWVYLPAFGPTEGPTSIRVMSFNVLRQNYDHGEVVELVSEVDPDVLVIVEYDSGWKAGLASLEESYPFRIEVPRKLGYDLALFSKLPIRSHEFASLTKQGRPSSALVANIEVGSEELRLIGIHVVSPISQDRLETRNQQFEMLGDYLTEFEDCPTVVAGDFNCTVWSPFLKRLMNRSKLLDSRQGFGYLSTWNANDYFFRIPIDHFLVSRQIHVHQRQVILESCGSDHFPILCEVSISSDR